MTTTSFSAIDPLTGYLYQIRYAFLDSLRRIKEDVRFSVSIETLDDIVFEPAGQPIELLQAKHHSNPANITDTSSDLWKTLRIWAEQYKTKVDSRYYLVTTSKALDGSIAYYLKKGLNRDEVSAIVRLDEVSRTSTNLGNVEGYKASITGRSNRWHGATASSFPRGRGYAFASFSQTREPRSGW